ncbi:carboxypeptidase regulatory-like domain-containing protein [Variovorax paradoxus]|nr:carboxypeptidase regulatory-like domain-containing protein [Variovorax paradoxus]
MTHFTQKIPHALSIVTLALLAACGGGGGGSGGGLGFIPPASNGGGDPPAAASTTLSGTAATGAAFASAALTVFDQTGAKVCEVKTSAEGTYTCTLPAGTKAPLVIQAVRDDLTLYSTTASAATGTTNVTPLTTIVVAQLSPNGDPSQLAAAIQADAGAVTAGSIGDRVAKLLAALQPLLSALDASIDPMSGEFQANGTGQDRVLDAINVSVRPDGAASNIEITVKALPAGEDSPPVSIVFRSGDATLPTLPAVDAAALASPPTPAMVQALLDRINACYALPIGQRVDSPIEADGNAYGSAVNVVAPACRTLFVGDDPANFVSAGAPVGRVSSGARRSFESLFRFGPTNLKHDRGNFEYFHANGDIALTFRWTDVLGNTDNDAINAKIVDGALKLTGNTHTYRAAVRPQLEKKDYLKHQNLVFHSVGYAVSIDNVRDGNGDPILSKVVATTASLPGRELVLVPKAGLNTLVLTPDGTAGSALNSALWRMSARYLDPAQPGSPSDFENANLFASPFYSDDDLRKVPDQTVWKLEFFRADGATPNVVQYVRTFSRVPTVAEAVQTPMVELMPALRAEMLAESLGSARGIVFGAPTPSEPNNVDFSADGDLDGWTVPAGALAPTSFGVFGRAPGPGGARFSETVAVRSTARKAMVYCQPVGGSDTHCVPAGNSSWQYAQGVSISTFSFAARTARQVDVRKNFEVWTVTLP